MFLATIDTNSKLETLWWCFHIFILRSLPTFSSKLENWNYFNLQLKFFFLVSFKISFLLDTFFGPVTLGVLSSTLLMSSVLLEFKTCLYYVPNDFVIYSLFHSSPPSSAVTWWSFQTQAFQEHLLVISTDLSP